MALVVKDRVQETTTTTGTGTITLGGAVLGFQSFATIGNGNTTYYTINDPITGDWEVGIGTYTASGTTLSRDTVLASSNAGALVPFVSGSKNVFVTYPSERAVYLDQPGSYPVQSTFNSLTAATATLTAGTISNAPTNGTDIVNKDYADSIASGLNYHQPVNYASVAALPSYVYNNGTLGVNATITASANGALSFGGGSPTAGQRLLVKDETGGNAPYNGVYTVTSAGSAGSKFQLTRATDYDSSGTGTNEVDAGDYVLVISGTNASTAWVQQTPLPIVIGTTALTFLQFNAPITYNAGTGLNLSPATTFNISDTGVTAATYGSASQVPVFAVNAQGQITSVTNTAIAIAAGAVSGLAASATTDTTNAANITSGTLPSARLSGSYTGVTGVGTLTAGTWNGSVIGPVYGGTGFGTYAVGDLLYADTTSTLAKLADVAVGNALISGGVGSAPSWGKIGLATHVSGTLPVANGGTGVTSSTGTGSVVLSTSPTLVTPVLGTPTSGDFSTGTFTWPTFNQNTTGTAAGLSVTLVATSGGTGQSSYAIGDLLYASSTTALSKLADVATGNALISGGVNTAPAWGKIALTTHVSGVLPTANGGTNLSSFTANGLVYASSTSALATSSALTFDGSRIALNTATSNIQLTTSVNTNQAYISLADADGRTAVFRGPNSGTPNCAQIGTTTNHETSFLYGGAEVMRLTGTSLYTASGINVGIGTSSPAYKLQVANNGNFNTTVNVSNTTAGTSSYARFLSISDGGNASFGMTSTTYTDVTSAADSLLINASGASGGIVFAHDGVGKMTLDTSGNLGIGTSSPQIQSWRAGTYLTVANVSTRGQIEIDGAVADSGSASLGALIFTYSTNTTNHKDVALIEATSSGATANQRGGVLNFYTKANGTASPALNMALDSSGNLGLGVTPSAWATSKVIQLGQGAIWNYNGVNNIYVGANYYFNGTNRIRIASGYAGEYLINGSDGLHSWYTAGTLTAGSTVTFTQAMTLDTSANLTATGSMRSPIFYDSNNTGYYLDPASTSVLNRLSLAGGAGGTYAGLTVAATTTSTGPIVAKSNSYSTAWSILPWASGSTYISSGTYYDNGVWVQASSDSTNCLFHLDPSGPKWYSSNNGTASWNVASSAPLWSAVGRWINDGTAPNDFRAPIFYDSNDTTYYLDPNSTSTSLNVAGGLVVNTNMVVGRGASAVATNTAVGVTALAANTSGSNNTAFGYKALNSLTTGTYNVAIGGTDFAGYGPLQFNTTGTDNIAIGTGAQGSVLSTGVKGNVAIGSRAGAGWYNTITTLTELSGSVCIGYYAGFYADAGSNVAIGSSALSGPNSFGGGLGVANTVAIGAGAGYNINTGGNSVIIGYKACYGDASLGTTPSNNVIIGSEAYLAAGAVSGAGTANSVIIGRQAGQYFDGASASANTFVGWRAYGTTAGQTYASQCTGIGGATFTGYTAAVTNSTCIGYLATITGSNQVQIGNSTTTTYVYGTVQNRSDARDKTDIRDTQLGLGFIEALRPVDFKWDMREDYTDWVPDTDSEMSDDGPRAVKPIYHEKDGSRKRNRYHHGLIAQEVKAVLDAKGIDFGGYQDHSIAGGKDVLSIGYDELVGPLIKAVQELSNQVKALSSELADLKAKS